MILRVRSFPPGVRSRAVIAASTALLLAVGRAAAPADSVAAAFPAAVRTEKVPEYEVIANYLAAFMRYVTWPPTDAASLEPLRIGVLGKDPFGPALGRILAGKSLGGRPLTAVYAASVDRLTDCRIVFINLPTPDEVAAVLAGFAGKPVLTVIYRRDPPAASVRGAVIELVRTEDNVRYLLNAGALTAQGLRPTGGLLENALNRPAILEAAKLPGTAPSPRAP